MELSSEVRNGTNIKRVRVSVACHILLNGEVDGITTRVNGKDPKRDNYTFIELFSFTKLFHFHFIIVHSKE